MDYKICYSAPGSIILLGEHAVLHGKRCITYAISNRISVTIKPLKTKTIKIFTKLGNYTIDIDNLNNLFEDGMIKGAHPASRFSTILSAIQFYNIDCGLAISITSNLPHSKGLGSSGALIIAFLACLEELKKGRAITEQDLNEIFLQAYKIINLNHNCLFSGYDLVSALYGGINLYNIINSDINQPSYNFKKINIKADIPLVAFNCGYKTPTERVLEKLRPLELRYNDIYKSIYDTMDMIIERALPAITKGEWVTLGELMNLNNGLLEAIGVSDTNLASMIYNLRNGGALGAKISGAGLGDCVIALEDDSRNIVLQGFEKIPLKACDVGLKKMKV